MELINNVFSRDILSNRTLFASDNFFDCSIIPEDNRFRFSVIREKALPESPDLMEITIALRAISSISLLLFSSTFICLSISVIFCIPESSVLTKSVYLLLNRTRKPVSASAATVCVCFNSCRMESSSVAKDAFVVSRQFETAEEKSCSS